MNENKFNLGLNLPQRHRKGVMTTFDHVTKLKTITLKNILK